MIWSVSTLARSSATAKPVCRMNGCMLLDLPDVDEPTSQRRRGCHGRTDQVGAAAGALATFEIAIRRRRAALAGFESIIVHAQAHRAARLAPFESGLQKY